MRHTAPPRRRGVPLVGALLATLVLVAGCAGGSAHRQDSQAATGQSATTVTTGNTMDQKVAATAATTRLVDQNGDAFTLRSLRGKTVVLAPFLTFCQETCPMTTANLHRAAEAAQGRGTAGQVVFLELSVDPQRDTVRRMKAYQRLYGALPDWRLATGNPAQVLALWRALGVSTEKTRPQDTVRDWLTGTLVHHSYDVHHQDVVMVLGASGRLRWITVGRPDARGTRLPTGLHAFLNEEGRRNYAHPNADGADSWTAHDVEQAVAAVRRQTSGG